MSQQAVVSHHQEGTACSTAPSARFLGGIAMDSVWFFSHSSKAVICALIELSWCEELQHVEI